MSEILEVLSCLPSELDQNDPVACNKFSAVATRQQKAALMLLSLERINEKSQYVTKTYDTISKKLQYLQTSAVYSFVVAEGGPLPPAIEVDGKLCPDDMPKEYTKISFFEDIISFPPQYLDKWLIFHGEHPEDFGSMDHLDRSKLLFVLKGGTLNDSVRKYEKE
ncbi:hypothetical protein I204_01875 [Kwoniella mangroviensis CBS 8886]|nr:uncharacterized protein I203_03818 [Kwoniella mangroviensis CBS 8507]OCF67133.1 hypothetical protein I203_03818 [Kwoniella mangroviensis CBS 8507]OCF77872.1 hypothetical protein I204_01875 [Kwoniella mangroviensis CBS 8886]